MYKQLLMRDYTNRIDPLYLPIFKHEYDWFIIHKKIFITEIKIIVRFYY